MLQIYHYCIHYLHDNDNIFRCSPLVILSADATISSFSTSLSQRFLPLRFLSSLFVFFPPLPCFDLIRLIFASFLNIFSFCLSPLCSIYWLFPCSPFPFTFLHVLLYYSCFFLLFFIFSSSFYTLLVYFYHSFPFCFPLSLLPSDHLLPSAYLFFRVSFSSHSFSIPNSLRVSNSFLGDN